MAQTPRAAPYPASQLVKSIAWDPEDRIVRIGADWNRTGDNWPMTWGDDDIMYTTFGDGDGFRQSPTKLTLGFSKIYGYPPNMMGEDIVSNIDLPAGSGRAGIKSSGLLMVDKVLYLWVRNYIPDLKTGDYRHSRLAWSYDRGLNWTWAPWYFSDTFGCPEFVQFGRNYAGARDDYVYIVSQGNDDAYLFDPNIVLARVPKDKIAIREAYEFFSGTPEAPAWSADIGRRKPIFTDPNGVQRVAITYNAPLRRYFLVTPHSDAAHLGDAADSPYFHLPSLGVFEAPEPWGPWRTVYYADDWSSRGWMIHHKFPTKWMSQDGKIMWLVFSGQRKPNDMDYCLMLRRVVLETA